MKPIKHDPEEIHLRFEPRYHGRILSGDKTCTTRRTRKGYPGDWFEVRGQVFRIVAVDQIRLQEVKERLYREEGFTNPDGFRRAWIQHFPAGGWNQSDLGWVHFFRRENGQK